MRILGIGETCDLGDMYWRLGRAGHEVRVFIEDARSHDVFGGMVERIDDWRAQLDWLRAGEDALVLFESASQGEWQDALRHDDFRVVGGSRYGDRLEDDREFGQAALRAAGLRTARSHRFDSFAAAIDFLRARPGRFVFKQNGAHVLRTRNYIGQLDSAADMIAFLGLQQAHLEKAAPEPVDFVLMEHVQGVEVGVGAYFDGHDFLMPALLDWEHKRFFPGELGELTGEMGTIVTYRGAETLFRRTLAGMAEPLRAAGHCGYINLNLIANAEGLWPLEFTSRFGYPGFAICDALHAEPWDAILRRMVDGGRSGDRRIIRTHPGYACGVVLTVPPFPYSYGYEEIGKGAPICFRETATAAQKDAVHFAEVARIGGHLATSGQTGYIGVATGVGMEIVTAQQAAYAVARQVVVPNIRFRNDIGDRVAQGALASLLAWGYVDEAR